jgi:hypothetical protein
MVNRKYSKITEDDKIPKITRDSNNVLDYNDHIKLRDTKIGGIVTLSDGCKYKVVAGSERRGYMDTKQIVRNSGLDYYDNSEPFTKKFK